eukprot:scaffold67940_cov60-Phaeocystis_antarctica.AAC.2
MPLCRRAALVLLLLLGGGHGVEHLFRGRRSRSWSWIAWRPRGGELRGVAGMGAPSRCARAPSSASAAAWAYLAARREVSRATWRGLRRRSSRSASPR